MDPDRCMKKYCFPIDCQSFVQFCISLVGKGPGEKQVQYSTDSRPLLVPLFNIHCRSNQNPHHRYSQFDSDDDYHHQYQAPLSAYLCNINSNGDPNISTSSSTEQD